MRDEDDEVINPDSWTTKELVKHIYRELKALKEELNHVGKDLTALKDDMNIRKAKEAEANKEFNKRVAMAGIIGTIIGFVIDAIINFFSM